MARRRQLYEGKAKILFEGPEPGTIVQYFKDDATAFNAEKKGTVTGKGILNNLITEYVFTKLEALGIPTHFVTRLNMREQLVRQCEIVPLEVVVRNVGTGSIVKRLGVEDGQRFPRPLVEYYYKDDALGDPIVAEDHIVLFGWASPAELEEMTAAALRINDFLSGMFAAIGIQLIDFKLEFGRVVEDGQVYLILADEFSPDNCRLWDAETGEKMDKDRFRQDLGGVADAYQEVARRLGISPLDEDLSDQTLQ